MTALDSTTRIPHNSTPDGEHGPQARLHKPPKSDGGADVYEASDDGAVQPQLFATAQQQLTSDDYYTPEWIFDALGLHFDLDVASPPHPTNVPCDRYYTQADDGLASPWYGRVWMNPPYSNPTPWVQKWLQHGCGIALLPMAKGCRWLNDLWNSDARLTVTRRIEFHYQGRTTQISFPTALWAIGDENVKALRKVGRVR